MWERSLRSSSPACPHSHISHSSALYGRLASIGAPRENNHSFFVQRPPHAEFKVKSCSCAEQQTVQTFSMLSVSEREERLAWRFSAPRPPLLRHDSLFEDLLAALASAGRKCQRVHSRPELRRHCLRHFTRSGLEKRSVALCLQKNLPQRNIRVKKRQ